MYIHVYRRWDLKGPKAVFSSYIHGRGNKTFKSHQVTGNSTISLQLLWKLAFTFARRFSFIFIFLFMWVGTTRTAQVVHTHVNLGLPSLAWSKVLFNTAKTRLI